jgi:voltage-gated potassium channel
VGPHERGRAVVWEQRLHAPMVAIACLVLAAFLLEAFGSRPLPRLVGMAVDIGVIVAFAAELCWMLYLVRRKGHYLARNWLTPLIVVSGVMSALGAHTEWLALGRIARLAVFGELLALLLMSPRPAFLPRILPYVIGFAIVSHVLAGAGFYFLDPSIHSFADGVWLAFVTGTTVGYGDMVPTTWPARVFAAFMVLVGFTLLSVITASIVAYFLGEEDKRLRRELRHDILELRARFEEVIGEEERNLRREMHRDIRELRDNVGAAIVAEQSTLRKEMAALRGDIESIARSVGPHTGRRG